MDIVNARDTSDVFRPVGRHPRFGVAPKIPRSEGVSWLEDPQAFRGSSSYRRFRVFLVIVALQTVLGTISPRSNWAANTPISCNRTGLQKR